MEYKLILKYISCQINLQNKLALPHNKLKLNRLYKKKWTELQMFDEIHLFETYHGNFVKKVKILYRKFRKR